ncbi:MAG: hypothetical protein L3K26_20175 [Candidatus Hydrogenedentes bacterium]|nr:hypothetical protein [Candidatus Hydrogenedentota bacterium]
MAVFASEAGVRLQVQVDDVAVVSSELVVACISEAHEGVLSDLDGAVDVNNPPTGLVQGETLLAAGKVLRALASGDAVEQVELQIGGQRIGAGQKFASLMSMARRFEKEAEGVLAVYRPVVGVVVPGTVTETVEVIGG